MPKPSVYKHLAEAELWQIGPEMKPGEYARRRTTYYKDSSNHL